MQDTASAFAGLYISFSLLICGYYIRVSDMTLSFARGLSWASFNKYAFQALAVTELGRDRQWSQACPVQTGVLPLSHILMHLTTRHIWWPLSHSMHADSCFALNTAKVLLNFQHDWLRWGFLEQAISLGKSTAQYIGDVVTQVDG